MRVALEDELAVAEPLSLHHRAGSSNALAELRLRDGRSLMVKRGRYAWDTPRFAASRAAADLLRRRTGVIAPRHLPVGPEIGGRAIEAYWRIELPTLAECWPSIPPLERARVLRSWGELLSRVHKVRLAGHGPLPRAVREPLPLSTFLLHDLGERLPPAIAAHWPSASQLVAALRSYVPDVASRVGSGPGVLLHNDAHMGNVLCAWRGGHVRCVGVLDLEAAMAGPREADLAHLQVLHGALFGQPLPDLWFEHVLEGYRAAIDSVSLAFFRAHHLLDLGFHAALSGAREHAGQVAHAVARELAMLADGV
jgi:aminoglycoside phosphotransferase (APT) family kinase protein